MASHAAAIKHFSKLYEVPFVDITVENWQDCINACPRKKRTKEDMKCLASLLYKYAHDQNLTDKNLAKNLFCGKEKEIARPPLYENEIEKVRRAVGFLPYADYVYALIYSGFRPGEFFKLEKSSYDRINECFIGGFKTKAGTDRSVTISPKIIEIVNYQYDSKDRYLFPDADGSMMDSDYFRKYCFKPLMEQLGIVGRVP